MQSVGFLTAVALAKAVSPAGDAPLAIGAAAHSRREIGSLAEQIAPTHRGMLNFADAAIAMKPPQRLLPAYSAQFADGVGWAQSPRRRDVRRAICVLRRDGSVERFSPRT